MVNAISLQRRNLAAVLDGISSHGTSLSQPRTCKQRRDDFTASSTLNWPIVRIDGSKTLKNKQAQGKTLINIATGGHNEPHRITKLTSQTAATTEGGFRPHHPWVNRKDERHAKQDTFTL
jgi:hypothetical protein